MADNFLIYDLVLLAAFAVFLTWFLYRGKKNLKREGFLLLYRTEWGMKLIDRVGHKYKKTLDFLGGFSVALGYLLMAGVLWLTYTIVKIYLLRPDVVNAIKVPPIILLIYAPTVDFEKSIRSFCPKIAYNMKHPNAIAHPTLANKLNWMKKAELGFIN